jgi:hypothetical protein
MLSAAAQTFDDRWSIIPKAHAEPAPEVRDQVRQDTPLEQPPTGEPTRRAKDRSAPRSSSQVFSGKASYYSYTTGKTASGSSFNRDALTAAHRNLPFGTRVRVTDLASSKAVVVRITDRGPGFAAASSTFHSAPPLGLRTEAWPRFALRCFSFCLPVPKQGMQTNDQDWAASARSVDCSITISSAQDSACLIRVISIGLAHPPMTLLEMGMVS